MIMPSHAKNVKRYEENLPLFARYKVEDYLSGMFNPTVQLPSGGYIVIGVTEALVAIDVNSGRATKEGSIEQTATKTNLEAAAEVARQLRLRDLAGLIVIDFIDMDERRNNTAVEKMMKDKLKTDRARIQVGRISGFGLMEMSRQRLRPGMIEATTQPCVACHGTGLIRSDDSLALSIIRHMEEEGTRRRTREVLIKAPVGIANFLMNAKREHVAQIEARYGMAVRIEGDPHLVSPDFTMEKFKTATRNVPVAGAHVVSVDTSLMDQIDEAEAEAAEAAEALAAAEEEADDSRSKSQQNGRDHNGEQQFDADGKPKRKRRRRRSRGGRGKNGGENGNNESRSDDADQNAAQSGDQNTAQGDAPQADATQKDAPKSDTTAEVTASDTAEEKPKKPTSRSRTRKPKVEVEAVAEAAADTDASASEVVSEPAEVKEKPKPKPRKRSTATSKTATSKKAKAAEETSGEDTPVEDGKAEVVKETKETKPKKPRASRAKPKPKAAEKAETAAPAPVAQETAAPPAPVAEAPIADTQAPEPVAVTPTPEPVAASAAAEPVKEEPKKPKKKGWWSLGR